MKTNNRSEKFSDKPERKRSAKEILLLDTLRYWGFSQAAANMDVMRERVHLDNAIAAWKNYPKCLDSFPTVITKKVKLDPKELA